MAVSWYFWPLAVGGGFVLSVIWIVILVLVLIDMLRANRSPEWKMIWVLILLVLPIVGAVLYYFIGRNQVDVRNWKDVYRAKRRTGKNREEN